MRAYTLSMLTQLANSGNPIVEKEIIDWVNNKLQSAQKTTSIRSFQDSAIADGKSINKQKCLITNKNCNSFSRSRCD